MSDKKPTSINGGCLCEAIRYRVTFPPDHDFTKQCSTCQCSQCRKQTGSLIFRVQNVPISSLEYTTPSQPAVYSASPGATRGFCPQCGSFLYWQQEGSGVISLCVGCFDQDALREYGTLLTYAEMHLYCEREIERVTDHLRGTRYKHDNEKGEVVILPERK